MNPRHFETLLRELDPEEMAPHSVRNHHVHGIDYLCLHRSDRLTVKLYFIDPAKLPRGPGAHLVTPHTHRYAFESTVLVGRLAHLRFRECADGAQFDRFSYAPELRSKTNAGEIDLWTSQREIHEAGGEYWCDTSDIHTLVVPEAPVLLGLAQFSDTCKTSTVYVRKGNQMLYPTCWRLTPGEAADLRDKALSMMGAV